MDEFKQLLDNPENNILVDIHSCPIRSWMIEKPYEEYFTTVPRNTYVVLISNLGQNKVGEEDVQHVDREMYKNPLWPWYADKQIIETAQIYFPGETIYNPSMMFGKPGDYDEFYDIFNVYTGEPYESFNKDDPNLLGQEDYKTYSRANILTYLRGNTGKRIVYIATCDPFGDKPESWSSQDWNLLLEEREKLQNKHRNKFNEFRLLYVNDIPDIPYISRNYDLIGRSSVGLDRDNQVHFDEDDESMLQGPIKAVSKNDENIYCISECDYKDTCLNNTPLIGAIAKSCQHKYCDFNDGTNGICVELKKKKQRRPSYRSRKKGIGGKRKLNKKKTKRRKTRNIKRKKKKTRKHKKRSRKTNKK